MNLNRQNNRCVTPPPMPPFGNRPIGRPGQGGRLGIGVPNSNPCVEVCTSSCDNTVCSEECNPCQEACAPCADICTPCSDNNLGNNSGVILSGYGTACNKEPVLQNMPLAMAYVPWQPYTNLYPLSQAVRQGTIFRDLDFEFMGRRCN